MPLNLKSVGLGVLSDDFVDKMLAIAYMRGSRVKGYYGIPYMNMHFGNVQLVLTPSTNHGEDRKFTDAAADIHIDSPLCCLWDVKILHPVPCAHTGKLTKHILVSPPEGDGTCIISVLNSDVLPSYKSGEKIKMQMAGMAVDVNYFAAEDDYRCREHEFHERLQYTEGSLPTGKILPLTGHSTVADPEDNSDGVPVSYPNFVTGIVKEIHPGVVRFGDANEVTFLRIFLETEFGTLCIAHSSDQVQENDRKYVYPGAYIACTFILNGDASIYIDCTGYEQTRENTLKLLEYSLSEGDPERLRTVMIDETEYKSEYNGKVFSGKDECIEWLQKVRRNTGRPYRSAIGAVDGRDCIKLWLPGKVSCTTYVIPDIDEKGVLRSFDTLAASEQLSLSFKPLAADTESRKETDGGGQA